MEKNEEEKLITGYFPSNVDDGVDLIFARAKLINIVASAFVFAPFIGLALLVGYLILPPGMPFIQCFATICFIGIAVIAFGSVGKNDESLPERIVNIIKFNMKKRSCYYNPRIKSEVVPMSSLSEDALKKNITPRDKMQEWYRQYSEEKTRSHFQGNDISFENIQFEDDIEFQKKITEKEKQINSSQNTKKKKGKKNGKKKKK